MTAHCHGIVHSLQQKGGGLKLCLWPYHKLLFLEKCCGHESVFHMGVKFHPLHILTYLLSPLRTYLHMRPSPSSSVAVGLTYNWEKWRHLYVHVVLTIHLYSIIVCRIFKMLRDTGFCILASFSCVSLLLTFFLLLGWQHVLFSILETLFLLVHSVRIWNNASRFNDDMEHVNSSLSGLSVRFH